MNIHGKTIDSALVIDDDDAFRATLCGAFRRRGLLARSAATAEEGIFSVEDGAVDLVVLDYRMRRGDGITALPRLRHALPCGVIIMLTGFGDIALAVKAVHEGADTLLSKPVDPDDLLREAAELKGRPRQGATGVTQPVSPLSYNLEEMEREAIKAALRNSEGVVARAAKLLGIDRRTLQRKLKKIF